jgi:hypothetical protein
LEIFFQFPGHSLDSPVESPARDGIDRVKPDDPPCSLELNSSVAEHQVNKCDNISIYYHHISDDSKESKYEVVVHKNYPNSAVMLKDIVTLSFSHGETECNKLEGKMITLPSSMCKVSKQ